MIFKSLNNLQSTIKTHLPYIYYILLTLTIFLPLFQSGYILTLDTIWAPDRNYLAEHILLGGIGGQSPFLTILQLSESILPASITQKIILFSIFVISGISAHISAPSNSIYGKYFAGTLYAINPFIYTRFLAGHLYLLLAYAFIPLAVKSFYDFLLDRNKLNRAVLWTTIVAIFTPHILFLVLLIQLCIFLFTLADKKNKTKDLIKNTILLSFLFLAVNTFWILPVFSTVSTGSSILTHISTQDIYAFTSHDTISGNILISLSMMYGFWRGGYTYPFNLAPHFIFIILFTIILFLAVHGLLSNLKNPLHKGLALSAIISVILACGITYPYFEPIFTYLFDHVFIFKGMRDSQKFIAVLVLAYSFLGSAGIDELVSGLKTNKRIISLSENRKKIFSISLAALILAVPLIYTFTIFNGFHGQIVPKDYPQEWYEVNNFLNNDTGDFDVLFFPWHLYMTFNWSARRIGNPASIFFNKPVIYGQNMEVGGIYTQSSNPTQHYIQYILEHRNEITNFGELTAPLNARYIILTKDVDYLQYDFLYNQSDLTLVMDNKELAVFKNQCNTSRIREVASLIEITHWSELIDQSKTIDINDYGFVLTFTDTADNEPGSHTTPSKTLTYTATSPFKYQIRDHINSNKYIIFTSPDHDKSGWLLSNSKAHDSPGLTSVFIPSGPTKGDVNIYFKPLYSHIIGSLISLAAISLILLYPYLQRRSTRR